MESGYLGEDILLFEPRFMDSSLGTGLWWCENIQDIQAYSCNCVCLSEHHKWEEVKRLTEWFQQFPYIFVASPKRELVEKVRYYVRGMPILSPDANAFQGCSGLCEYVVEHGIADINELLFKAHMEQVYGILELSKVELDCIDNIKRTLSGFQYLDANVGGFRPGELSVWTGKRGEGKSTLLSQILLEALKQDEHIMAYSGELPARQFKRWAMQQAARLQELEGFHSELSDKLIYHVKQDGIRRINAEWEGKYFLIDINADYAHDERNILDNFLYAYRVLGCSTFLVDNIMTANLMGDKDFYRAQSKFAQALSRFSKANNVHVHLVAHPRKSPKDKPIIDGDDISGSGDIANIADNVFSVRRMTGEEKNKYGCDTMINILKCRETGMLGMVMTEFDARRRRYRGLKESWAQKGMI